MLAGAQALGIGCWGLSALSQFRMRLSLSAARTADALVQEVHSTESSDQRRSHLRPRYPLKTLTPLPLRRPSFLGAPIPILSSTDPVSTDTHGSTSEMGEPLRRTRPRPGVTCATAVAVFFLPKHWTADIFLLGGGQFNQFGDEGVHAGRRAIRVGEVEKEEGRCRGWENGFQFEVWRFVIGSSCSECKLGGWGRWAERGDSRARDIVVGRKKHSVSSVVSSTPSTLSPSSRPHSRSCCGDTRPASNSRAHPSTDPARSLRVLECGIPSDFSKTLLIAPTDSATF